ncbi:hypothetical protein Nepgr_000995 [Nepenthes gracilis]|uniref:Uncharacterized protein n=1 Tax=Nepenthes gracilis TaxID=150966 RepID=A0AAD3P3P0_NEPGR|nr:hypothetical protein Nepgr_000995 [Nepenthes gracilis]
MAVRFKFRSSSIFDSIDLRGRSTISICDLKGEIVRKNNLNLCQDFNLVVSDALTGQEYGDENIQIPCGSSVIIKRVPAGSLPSVRACNVPARNIGIKETNRVDTIEPPSARLQMDDFDDFGVDLCPLRDANLPGTVQHIDERNFDNGESKALVVPRFSEVPGLRCQKPEASELNQSTARDPSANQGSTLEIKSKGKIDECTHLKRAYPASHLANQSTDLPSELQCALCHTLFKEAVMIPCCQHSFCEKCISEALAEKGKCPICSSSKCSVDDLLPNLSLRQAIERFLESQILINDSEDVLHRYAPDGESGIQVKDATCAVNIALRDLELPQSPSATGKGSNQIMEKSIYESQFRRNSSMGGAASHVAHLAAVPLMKSASFPNKIHGPIHPADVESKPRDSEDVCEFQGENQPLNMLQCEEESSAQINVGFGIRTGERNFTALGRNRRGERTCYMCGSPDHLIRDCPVAASSHPVYGNGAMPGYAPPFWNQAPLSHVRPFANIYSSAVMMPYNASIAPLCHHGPFTVPSYAPSVYGGLPVPSGYVNIGGMTPPIGLNAKRVPSQSELLELHDREMRQKHLSENSGREHACDRDQDFNQRYHFDELGRSHDLRSQKERERCVNYYEDGGMRRPEKIHKREKLSDDYVYSTGESLEKSSHSSKGGKDHRISCQERSTSEIEEMPDDCACLTERSHKHHHHHASTQNYGERRGRHDNDSSRSHHHSDKVEGNKIKRIEQDQKKYDAEHHSHSESGLEHNYSSDRMRRRRDKESSEGSRHSRRSAKSTGIEVNHDRWKMAGGSDNDYGEDQCGHKRKRVH